MLSQLAFHDESNFLTSNQNAFKESECFEILVATNRDYIILSARDSIVSSQHMTQGNGSGTSCSRGTWQLWFTCSIVTDYCGYIFLFPRV